MDIGVAQQLVVNIRFRGVGDAVAAEHKDFAYVILSSPFADVADFVGLEVDERVHFAFAQILMAFGESLLEIHSLAVEFLVLAPPNHSALPLVGSGVLHQRHVLRNAQQQLSESMISLAFLPHAEEHPLESERREVLPYLAAETRLAEAFGGISAGIVEQRLLDLTVSVGVVGELATEVQPFAVLPCRAVELEGKAPCHVGKTKVESVDDVFYFLERPYVGGGDVGFFLT